ncbi:hypothetical protein D3C72_2151920 [compost metagenome]
MLSVRINSPLSLLTIVWLGVVTFMIAPGNASPVVEEVTFPNMACLFCRGWVLWLCARLLKFRQSAAIAMICIVLNIQLIING